MNLGSRFDLWVQQGSITSADLGIFRILFSVSTLLTVRDITWLNQYPSSLYDPPPGPFVLLPGFPPTGVLVILEVLQSLVLVMLGLGLFTRFSSFATAGLLLLTLGLTYTLGKINHTFLTVLVPLVLAFSNWGDRFSIDAASRRIPEKPQVQWPLRYLALTIALAFASAAIPKLRSGYLDPATQSVYGYFMRRVVTEDPTWLSDAAIRIGSPAVWEAIDWLAVALEFAVFFSMPWWRSFRTALAMASIFHLGVFLILGIKHTTEVVAYGAFVAWAAIVARSWLAKSSAHPSRLLATKIGIGSLLGLGVFKTWAVISGNDSWIENSAKIAVLFFGAAIGIGYLVFELVLLLRYLRRSDSKPQALN